MSREKRTSLKSKLAAAPAEGKSSAEWASAHGVAERMAQRWANEPEVRADVESFRRGTLDQAVGQAYRVPAACGLVSAASIPGPERVSGRQRATGVSGHTLPSSRRSGS
jgi:hypothetical protein